LSGGAPLIYTSYGIIRGGIGWVAHFSLLGDTYYKYTITQLLVPFMAIYRRLDRPGGLSCSASF